MPPLIIGEIRSPLLNGVPARSSPFPDDASPRRSTLFRPAQSLTIWIVSDSVPEDRLLGGGGLRSCLTICWGWDRLCKRIFREAFGGHFANITERDSDIYYICHFGFWMREKESRYGHMSFLNQRDAPERRREIYDWSLYMSFHTWPERCEWEKVRRVLRFLVQGERFRYSLCHYAWMNYICNYASKPPLGIGVGG